MTARARSTCRTGLAFVLLALWIFTPARAARLDGGDEHACAVTAAGAVKCWGENNYGQLGDGSQTASATPVDVIGLGSGVRAVAVGLDHSCAVLLDGRLKCWGRNTLGQVGTGVWGDDVYVTPVDVAGFGGAAVDVVADYYSTCALRADGAVRCWGNNQSGQLGIGGTGNAWQPATVSGLGSGVRAIGMGQSFACAALEAGGVRCWGDDGEQQLGNGAVSDNQLTPVAVQGVEGIVFDQIVGGAFHLCARSSAGALKCWGTNHSGAVGAGPGYAIYDVPVDVVGMDGGVLDLGAAGAGTCAVRADRSVACWGNAAITGDGDSTARWVPTDVVGLAAPGVAVAGGHYFACAIDTTDRIACWGRNNTGQIGDGSLSLRTTPQPVAGLAGVATIDVGINHACARTATDSAYCWGQNNQGQVGDGTLRQRLLPTAVSGLSGNTLALQLGGDHACAIDSAGAVRCWGSNGWLQLGLGFQIQPIPQWLTTPYGVNNITAGVTALDSGYQHSCAVQGGALRCWGANSAGQLGNGATSTPYSPVYAHDLGMGTVDIAAGGNFTCALRDDASIWCWGNNGSGQLGSGDEVANPWPAPVDDLEDTVALAAGYAHACALDSTGAVHCWGDNSSGQLGIGGTTDSNVPMAVTGLGAAAAEIAAGWFHTCARLVDGRVACWGENLRGQLGNGSRTNASTPVIVADLANATSLGLGGYSSCAVQDGSAYCWGDNAWGQLGNDEAGNYAMPRHASGFPFGPQIVALQAPADGYYRAGESLVFRLTYALAVAVTGAPQLTLGTEAGARGAVFAGGAGTAADPLRFEYTVAPGDDSDGLVLQSPQLDLAGGTIVATDFPDAVAAIDLPAVDLAGIVIDTVAPQVSSVVRIGASPSAALEAQWAISFDEPVEGVDASDFSLLPSGAIADAVLLDVAPDGDTWRATAGFAGGNGTLGLALLSGGITDRAGNPTAAGFTGGDNIIIDRSVTLAMLAHTPEPSALGGDVLVTWQASPMATDATLAGTVTVGDGSASCNAPVATGQCMLTLGEAGVRTLAAGFASANANYTDASAATQPHQVNTPPRFDTAALAGGRAATPYSATVAVRDEDDDAVAIEALDLPAWLALSDNGDGTALLTGTPSAGDVGSQVVRLRASDGLNATDRDYGVAIAGNDAPEAQPGNASGHEDDTLDGTLFANDGDGDILAFAIATPPAHGDVELLDDATGAFVYTPDPDYFGNDSFAFTASDASSTSAAATIALTVAPVNDPPSLSTLADRSHAGGVGGAFEVPGFAVPAAFGPPNEAGQGALAYDLTPDDPDGILATIAIDAAGTLRYTLSGASGLAHVDAALVDDGGDANGGDPRSEPQRFAIGVGSATDLVLQVDNARSGVLPGETLRYAIEIENLGPDDAPGTRIDATLSATLVDVDWSCALCTPTAGSGAPTAVSLDLAKGAGATIEVYATVSGTAGSFVELAASAAIAAGITALVPADDSDTDSDPILPSGLFRDGFEGAAPSPQARIR